MACAQVARKQTDGNDRARPVAVVTGAGGGVGRAISAALAREGMELCLLGRDSTKLAASAAVVRPFSPVTEFPVDLTVDDTLQPLMQHLEDGAGRLDVLIHCAAVAHLDLMERAGIADFDLQYATNVRAPYTLTQRLLPLLIAARGQIVFINSSVGLTAKRADVGQYAATKHALRAIADSLREEVNPMGIRVLTVYLGRTATPMQEAICRQEGRVYEPETLLQPEDVASVVLNALMLPSTAEVTDLSIRPMTRPGER